MFPEDVIAAVTAHMNHDHPDDNTLIVRAFAAAQATSATMVGLDSEAGYWDAEVDGQVTRVRIPWSTTISERPEIRREVVVLYTAACAALGVEPRSH